MSESQAILLRLPRWAHRTIKAQAALRGCHMSALMVPALEALALGYGGSPVDGANPSPAQPDETAGGAGACPATDQP